MIKLLKTHVILILLLVFVVSGTFMVKYKVATLKNEFALLEKNINRNQAKLVILEAEWAYLNTPVRLEKLAAKYLQRDKIVTVSQLKNMHQLRNYYYTKYPFQSSLALND